MERNTRSHVRKGEVIAWTANNLWTAYAIWCYFFADGDEGVGMEVTGGGEEGETHPTTTKEDEGSVKIEKVD